MAPTISRLVLFPLAWSQLCAGAGLTAHNVAARRALQYFQGEIDGYEALIRDNWASLSAGAPFPDYLFACGGTHSAGDEAHHVAFQEAAVRWMREKNSWSQILNKEQNRRLVAFLAGVVSHYITDINWHGVDQVPSPHGFLEQLGTSNFKCHGELCSSAHTQGDWFGELVAAHEVNLDWFLVKDWWIPVNDLVDIYNFANETAPFNTSAPMTFPKVKPQWIEECAAIFTLGGWAIKHLGSALWPAVELLALQGSGGFPPSIAGSAHLSEAFIHWVTGGMDDDAMWSAGMWNRLAQWLKDGPPSGPVPNMMGEAHKHKATAQLVRAMRPQLLELYKSGAVPIEITKDQALGGVHIGMRWDGGAEPALALGRVLAEAVLGKDSAVIDVDAVLQERIAQMQAGLSGERRETRKEATATQLQQLNGSYAHEYCGMGAAVSEFAGGSNGCKDLVIGCPGYGTPGDFQRGRVLVFRGKCTANQVPSFSAEPDGELEGPAGQNSRFGWSMAAGDLDGDGLPDIVAGGPAAGSLLIAQPAVGNYTGLVHVILSSGGQTEITSLVPWASFGMSVAVGDLDGDGHADLAVGAPFAGSGEAQKAMLDSAGRVFVFKGPLSAGALSTADAIATLDGTSFGWLGHRVSIHNKLLLASAPTHRRPKSDEAVGQLAAYRLVGGAALQLVWSVTGEEWMSKTGFSVAVQSDAASPLLAISAPTKSDGPLDGLVHRHVGEVLLLPLGQLHGHLSWSQVKALPGVVALTGETSFGRLGWSLAFAKGAQGEDLLLMSAPFAGGREADYAELGEIVQYEVKTGVRKTYTVPREVAGRLGEGPILPLGNGAFATAAIHAGVGEDAEMRGTMHILSTEPAGTAALVV